MTSRSTITTVPDLADDRPGGHHALEPGTKVEVRTGFDRSWASGFVVEEATDSGYLVRRHSDQRVLPRTMPHDDVRREKKNSMWWY